MNIMYAIILLIVLSQSLVLADLKVELSQVRDTANLTLLCEDVVTLFTANVSSFEYCSDVAHYENTTFAFEIKNVILKNITSSTVPFTTTMTALNELLTEHEFFESPAGKVVMITEETYFRTEALGLLIGMTIAMIVTLGIMLWTTNSFFFSYY